MIKPPNHAQQQTPLPVREDQTRRESRVALPARPQPCGSVRETVTNVVFFLSSCRENAQSKTAPSWPSSNWTSDNAESLLSRHRSALSNVPSVATRTTPSEPPQATRPLPPDDTHHKGPPHTCLAWTTSTRHPGAPMNSSLNAASTLREASAPIASGRSSSSSVSLLLKLLLPCSCLPLARPPRHRPATGAGRPLHGRTPCFPALSRRRLFAWFLWGVGCGPRRRGLLRRRERGAAFSAAFLALISCRRAAFAGRLCFAL